jgi:hypothetical protein
VFKCFPYFPTFITSMMSVIVPYVCPVFCIWFEYPEFPLLFLIACTRSLYLVWHVLCVCPMYFNRESMQFFWYMPLFSCIFVCEYGLIMFLYVLYSEYYFYLRFFKLY